MTTIIDGSANADFATPLPLTEGGTGIATATTAIVQIKNVQTGAVATGTTQIPNDDTIPQITEGTEFMTLAITPTSATSILEVTVVTIVSNSGNNHISTALFRDAVSDALAADTEYTVATATVSKSFVYQMIAGTTAEIIFRVRIGAGAAGTNSFNGVSGARRFGGVMSSSITIKEYTA